MVDDSEDSSVPARKRSATTTAFSDDAPIHKRHAVILNGGKPHSNVATALFYLTFYILRWISTVIIYSNDTAKPWSDGYFNDCPAEKSAHHL